MSARPQKSARRRAVPAPELAGQPPARVAERRSRIAMAAYFIAERRGFVPGHELEDWLAAEAEIDSNQLPSLVTSIEISAKGKAS